MWRVAVPARMKGQPTIRLEGRHDVQRLAGELRVSWLDGSTVHHKCRPVQPSHGNEASRHVLVTAWQRNVGIVPAKDTSDTALTYWRGDDTPQHHSGRQVNWSCSTRNFAMAGLRAKLDQTESHMNAKFFKYALHSSKTLKCHTVTGPYSQLSLSGFASVVYCWIL